MDTNFILRRLRYILDLGDAAMMELFSLAGLPVSRAEVSDWLKKEDDPLFREISPQALAAFLNGLIVKHRGRKEGMEPVNETALDNNLILKKIKIALDLKTDVILEIFELADRRISPHELSAFLRKPGQSQYRICNDQYLRNFLFGLQVKYRKTTED